MAASTHFPALIPTPAPAATTYSDLNGLAALKANSNSPQALHAVAQQVDALFLQMMLKSMRDAAADIGQPESNEMGIYQDMFDKQIALTMSQHLDLGLGSLLTRQLAGAQAQPVPAPAAARAVPASPAGIAQSAEEFVSQVLPTIREAAQALGVSPLGMLAQAALETGWGKRMARTAGGAPSLNLFGIKADDGWDGGRATANTLEIKDGVATPQRTAFRAYGSIRESVEDFANLLQSSPRYRQTIATGSNAETYVANIGKSGYATDPQYADKLNEILNSGTLRTALKNTAYAL